MFSEKLTAQEIPREERDVGGALGQAAHEVGEPFAAIRDVDAQAVAIFDETALKVSAHAVEHLKLKTIFGDVVCSGEANGRGNHGGIVSGYAVIDAAGQQHLHDANVIGVDVPFFRIGDFGRLLVGAFAEANAAT